MKKILLIAIFIAGFFCGQNFAQVAVTPQQTKLGMGPSGVSAKATISGRRVAYRTQIQSASNVSGTKNQLDPDEPRYSISSAYKSGGKWIFRILDNLEKKTYTIKEGTRDTASSILIENFDSENFVLHIDVQNQKIAVQMKISDKANIEKKNVKQVVRTNVAPVKEEDAMQIAARKKTKENITAPAKN